MTETKKCIYCGRDLEADMIFCPRCGRPVPTERQDDDKLGETLIFNINDRSIPPVPVMRTAKLVDTGIFPVIKDENFPKETPAVPKKPVEEKPAEPVMPELIQEETSDDDLLSFLDLGDDNDEPEEKIAASSSIPLFFTSSIPAMNPSAPKEEIPEPVIPAVPAEEPAVEEAPPAAPAEEQQTEEAPEETIRMTVDEPEAEDVPDSFNIPFVQRETDHTITMEDLPVIEDISEENLKEETSEYDALGDLHNVLKTLLADDSTTEEEDVLDGNYTRDSRPADSSYDVPFILRQTRNDDENTQTALRLAGLNPDEPEGSDFVNPLDEEADTEELDVPFILSKAPAHLDPQTTEIYTNLFREEENAEKKLVDEGQTVIFKPVEKEPEPVRKPEPIRKPEPAPEPEKAVDLNIPKKPAKREIELNDLQKSEPPVPEDDEKKGGKLWIALLALLLLALLAGALWFFLLRDRSGGSKPVSTPEPTAETLPADATASAEPENTPEPTPEVVVEEDPDYFKTISRNFKQLYTAYLNGSNNGDMSSVEHIDESIRTALQNRVAVNRGYSFTNRKFSTDRTTYELSPSADTNGYYTVRILAEAENDGTRLSDNAPINNKSVIASNMRYNPQTGDWYATSFEVNQGFSVAGHELVEITD
ncbi:MAG: hypothetical protein Q4D46_01500 [Erysipelotrichaceae bacterium]|nr:hypothetical protein [Erysipelotrichaceae bacterium]